MICDVPDAGQIRAMFERPDREFGRFAYDVGQAGVIQITSEMSTGWASRGVRVNAIAPAKLTNTAFEVRMQNTPGLRDTFLTLSVPSGTRPPLRAGPPRAKPHSVRIWLKQPSTFNELPRQP